ncbi:hypothetical protein ACU4GD_35635 [Cupriavidus basilensis]
MSRIARHAGLLILESLASAVLPMPFDDATLRFALGEAEALDLSQPQWGGQPPLRLPLRRGTTACCTCGAPAGSAAAARRAACARLGGEAVEPGEADALWRAARARPSLSPRCKPGRALWRIAVPTTAASCWRRPAGN